MRAFSEVPKAAINSAADCNGSVGSPPRKLPSAKLSKDSGQANQTFKQLRFSTSFPSEGDL